MKQFLLPLDIQLFSAEPGANPEEHTDPIEQTEPTNQTGGEPGTNPEAKFTQEDVNRFIQERLDREKRKREADVEKERQEAERQRLEDEKKYKDLYESLQKDLEAQRATAIQVKKESLLAQAGYSEEQSKTLVKLIEGEDDEALKASLEDVKKLFPPTKEKPYGDPSPGNGGKQTPKKTNLEEKGKSAYERLKQIGKIRGKN